MAELRPLRALRYDPAVAGDASMLVAPPYDVVAGAARQALYDRSQYNVSRVDYGEGANRYERAGRDLTIWEERGVLTRDETPRLYVYDQEFAHDGKTYRRRAVFTALRLEEWEKGIVLPHEVTGDAAKADRFELLRATRVQTSPVMALYREDAASPPDEALGKPVLDAVLPDERHTLRPVAQDAAEAFCRALAPHKLYIADGHHRYETALNYRNECRAAATSWTGEEPENFILVALISAADPGLVVLPTHRLLKLEPFEISLRKLRLFDLDDAGAIGDSNLKALLARLQRTHGPAYGAIGLEPGRMHLVTPRDVEAVVARAPRGHSDAWRRLDVTVLQYVVLPAVGFDEAPEHIDYTEHADVAAEAVASGAWDVAFLLNPTPVSQVFAVADAGERMPRKSTFFFPKLATGVLMLPYD
ncbi:MAG TPA: DUF1015 domain-containing protein [Dehalococcoidia bacterium]|nr:DUF1015 domain-containing protein [Dehalococcoidia bacterium]